MQPTQDLSPGDATNQVPDVAGYGKWPLGGGLGSPLYPHRAADPRTSSTQSLVSSMDSLELGQRRTLLVVYIHGFMGNNSSFRSFPAHVHSFLKDILAETHVIHTKIYPRYKTYKSIEVACDNFSSWLAPHESPTTDVVLVGHSMGGLLAAEVVLLVCVPWLSRGRHEWKRLTQPLPACPTIIQRIIISFPPPDSRHRLSRRSTARPPSRHRGFRHC